MRILFVGNSGPVFLTHRLPLVLASLKEGHEVHVALPPSPVSQKIASYDYTYHEIPLSRSGVNPFTEIISLLSLYFLYRKIKPNLIHHVTIKPVLYGSLAAYLANVPAIANTISGLGYVFVTQSFKAKLLRTLIKFIFRIAFLHPNNRVIFQNPENLSNFVSFGLIGKKNVVLIKGSGVDTDIFNDTPEPDAIPVVMVASRMLFDKGIVEFVDAASIVRNSEVKARFVLVGDIDLDNPMSIKNSQLNKWVDEGIIEWWGNQEDMPKVFSQAHVVSLPSYAEGLPKVLIEASSCGRPIVTTNVSGCKETVREGENGFLVPVKNSKALAEAFIKLISDKQLRQSMGNAGREMAVKEFSIQIVIEQTFEVYQDLLKSLKK
jgi:glycosyltransferase involved in cell wall biosynthesis